MLVFAVWLHGKLKWLTMRVLKVIQVCVSGSAGRISKNTCRSDSRCFNDGCTGPFDSPSQTIWLNTDVTYSLSFWLYLTPLERYSLLPLLFCAHRSSSDTLGMLRTNGIATVSLLSLEQRSITRENSMIYFQRSTFFKINYFFFIGIDVHRRYT